MGIRLIYKELNLSRHVSCLITVGRESFVGTHFSFLFLIPILVSQMDGYPHHTKERAAFQVWVSHIKIKYDEKLDHR